MRIGKKLLLIYNPKSGKSEFLPHLGEAVDRFTKAGFEVTVRPTQGPGDAREHIARRARHFHTVCVSGGDGTLSEVINALMCMEKRPSLGYIPSGSTNDFATSLKIPKDPLAALDALVDGTPAPIDVGCFGDRFFAYVAAFGLFTDVTYGTPQQNKNLLGHAAYLLEGVKRLASIPSYDCKITVDSEVFSGNFIFGMASNSTSIGGFKASAVAPAIELDDGLFEVALVKRPRSFLDLQNIVASLLSREIHTGSLIIRRAKTMRVTSKEGVVWTLDGEFGGETTDVTIHNAQKALEILLPHTLSDLRDMV